MNEPELMAHAQKADGSNMFICILKGLCVRTTTGKVEDETPSETIQTKRSADIDRNEGAHKLLYNDNK